MYSTVSRTRLQTVLDPRLIIKRQAGLFSLAIVSFVRRFPVIRGLVCCPLRAAHFYRDSDSLLAVLNQFCSWPTIGKYFGMSLPVNRPSRRAQTDPLSNLSRRSQRRGAPGRVTYEPSGTCRVASSLTETWSGADFLLRAFITKSRYPLRGG